MRLSLFVLRDLALKSGRMVFSIQQLANLVGKPKKIAKVYASRLVKKGLGARVLRGKISFTDDDFVVATQLVEPSYVSLRSAFLFHGLAKQVPNRVQCVTPTNSRIYGALGIVYHKIPPGLFYGYEKQDKGASYVFVAEPEKALIDSVYLNAVSRQEAKEFVELVDKQKLKGLLARYTGFGKKKLEEWLS